MWLCNCVRVVTCVCVCLVVRVDVRACVYEWLCTCVGVVLTVYGYVCVRVVVCVRVNVCVTRSRGKQGGGDEGKNGTNEGQIGGKIRSG